MLDYRDLRPARLIACLIIHRIGTIARYQFAVNQDAIQTGRLRRYFDKLYLIGISHYAVDCYFDLRRTFSVRSGDGHLLSFLFVHRDLRAGLSLKLIDVPVGLLTHEARQRSAVQIDHLQISVGGGLDHKVDRIDFLRLAVLRGHSDDLGLTLQYAQYALRGFHLVIGDGRDLADAYRQRVDIMQRVFMETLQGLLVQIDHRQIRYTRGRYREMDDIRVAGAILRTNGDLIVSVQARGHRTWHDILQRLGGLRRIGNRRQSRRALRQTHPVLRHRGIVADRYAFAVLQAVALYAQVGKRVIRISIHVESNLIDGGIAVAGSHGDTCFAVHAGRHGYGYLLELIRRHGFYHRHRGRSDRQRVRVRGLLRTEIRNEHAADLDAGETRVLGFLGIED